MARSPTTSNIIANGVRRHAVRLFRFSTALNGRVQKRLSGVRADLVAILAQGDPTEPARLGDRLNRIDVITSEARKRVANRYRSISTRTANELLEVAETDQSIVAQLITRTADYGITTLPARQLRRIVDRALVDGAPSADWWRRQAAAVVQRYHDEITQGMRAGESIGQLITRVRATDGLMMLAQHQAEALMRSSVMSVAHDTRMAEFAANADVVDGWAISTTFDDRTCERCMALSGASFDLEGNPLPGSPFSERLPSDGLPIHFGCLPGDSHITAADGIAAASERRFDGDLLIIRTAAGNELACTPNHPILTNGGWRAARSLNIGGYVIGGRIGERRNFRDLHHQDVPARIHEIADTCRRAGRMGAHKVPVSAEDFHGDGSGSQVAVIWVDRLLRDCLDAALAQQRAQVMFMGTDPLPFDGVYLRSLDQLFERHDCAASRIMRSAHLLRTRGGRHAGPFQQFRFTAATNGNAGRAESWQEGASGDAQLIRELLQGRAGYVRRDQIVNIDVRPFVGQVYNLQTRDGYYVSSNIVTHNCRCIATPILVGEAPPQDLSFEAWLEEQPEDEQKDILGPKWWAAWHAGELKSLRDLIDQKTRPITLKELRGEEEEAA